jgi:hypothetical protein
MICASTIHYKKIIYYYVIIINCILNIYMLEVCGVGREPWIYNFFFNNIKLSNAFIYHGDLF